MHSANYIFRKSQMCLIHLPKSGGSTITKIINDNKLEVIADTNHRPISKFCDPKSFKYIILLRNPVDRVISYYNMVLRNKYYEYKEYSASYKLFLNNCWEVNNQLTLYLAGIDCKQMIKKNIKINDNFFKLIFDRAKNNLKNIKSVIFFDNYESSVKKFFKNNFNLQLDDIPHLRNHKYSKKVSDYDYNLIKNHNKYDILLYEYAKSLKIN